MQESKLYLENEELIEHLIAEGQEEHAQIQVAGAYATNRFTQLVALARKFRLAYWRSPSYNLTRMLMTLLICLFYGTVFWGRGRVPDEGAPCTCPLYLCLSAWWGYAAGRAHSSFLLRVAHVANFESLCLPEGGYWNMPCTQPLHLCLSA